MKNESNALNQLENVETYLSEDIQALEYLQEEYFGYTLPGEDFCYKYAEIQNAIAILLKAMILNKNNLKEYIKKYQKSG